MSDDLPSLRKKNLVKKNKSFAEILLAIVAGLFFLCYFNIALSSSIEPSDRADGFFVTKSVDFGELDPMFLIKKYLSKTAIEKEGITNKKSINEKYASLVLGYPIENMLLPISDCKDKTAAFLLAIAKKESNWGEYAPRKNGKDCYNYWGYRGDYSSTDSGFSCFDSPEQAVGVVAQRIEQLIAQNIDTPQKMIVWKCGNSCAGHNISDVKRWISDVAMYWEKLIS